MAEALAVADTWSLAANRLRGPGQGRGGTGSTSPGSRERVLWLQLPKLEASLTHGKQRGTPFPESVSLSPQLLLEVV